MAFTESLKLKVKKMAMFQCCRCHGVGIDVHHIIPQEEHGPDTLDNAAPLCQNCHDQFGANPLKRKEITQMRDNWYEAVERMYSGKASVLIPLVEKINTSLEEVKEIQSKDIREIKTMLKEVSNRAIDNMTLGTVNLTASNLVMASGASLSNVNMNQVRKILTCGECKQLVGVRAYETACPYCGASLE